ncbi:MAG: DUF3795 domain-containing protein [Ruminococcus sp.]|nr:DUF3795 domain-containing protein [Ruminococcus sp.]
MEYEKYISLGRTERIEHSIAPCGLVCELCSERTHCKGCNFSKKDELECCCHQRRCCDEKGLEGCWECSDFPCGKDMQNVSIHGVRLIAFTEYVRRYSRKALAERLVENEKNGIIYHRDPVNYTGDYDGYISMDEVIALLENGEEICKVR